MMIYYLLLKNGSLITWCKDMATDNIKTNKEKNKTHTMVVMRFAGYILSSLIITGSFVYLFILLESNTNISPDFEEMRKNLFSIAVTFSVGILGFLITALAIIVSFFDNQIMQKFNQTEGLDNLITTFKYAFASLFFTIIMLIVSTITEKYTYMFVSIILFCLLFNIQSVYRCINVIFIIIKNTAKIAK